MLVPEFWLTFTTLSSQMVSHCGTALRLRPFLKTIQFIHFMFPLCSMSMQPTQLA